VEGRSGERPPQQEVEVKFRIFELMMLLISTEAAFCCRIGKEIKRKHLHFPNETGCREGEEQNGQQRKTDYPDG
jgi:hypothetical protein